MSATGVLMMCASMSSNGTKQNAEVFCRDDGHGVRVRVRVRGRGRGRVEGSVANMREETRSPNQPACHPSPAMQRLTCSHSHTHSATPHLRHRLPARPPLPVRVQRQRVGHLRPRGRPLVKRHNRLHVQAIHGAGARRSQAKGPPHLCGWLGQSRHRNQRGWYQPPHNVGAS